MLACLASTSRSETAEIDMHLDAIQLSFVRSLLHHIVIFACLSVLYLFMRADIKRFADFIPLPQADFQKRFPAKECFAARCVRQPHIPDMRLASMRMRNKHRPFRDLRMRCRYSAIDTHRAGPGYAPVFIKSEQSRVL